MEAQRRRKGSGHLFQRNGVWYIRFRRNGGEKTVSTGCTTLRDAERALKPEIDLNLVRDREARVLALSRLSQTISEQIAEQESGIAAATMLSDLPALFRNSPRRVDCSPEQLRYYLSYIGHFCAFAPDARMSDVDDNMADQYARAMQDEFSPNTQNKHLNCLTMAWDAVGPSVGILSNPWKRIPRRKLDTAVRRAMTDDEIASVIAAADGELRTLIAVGAYTGMRMGDCAHLRWSSVDLDAGFIDVVTSKTKSRVSIPIHPALRAVLGPRKNGFVTPGLAAQHDRDSGVVSTRVARVFSKCGIETSTRKSEGARARPLCGFHSLRHSFVSRAIEAGVPPSVVQAVVGHASAAMTEHYTHISDRAILDAFARMK